MEKMDIVRLENSTPADSRDPVSRAISTGFVAHSTLAEKKKKNRKKNRGGGHRGNISFLS